MLLLFNTTRAHTPDTQVLLLFNTTRMVPGPPSTGVAMAMDGCMAVNRRGERGRGLPLPLQ